MNIKKRVLILTTLTALLAIVPSAFAIGGYGGGVSAWGIIIGAAVFMGILAIWNIKIIGKEKELEKSGVKTEGFIVTIRWIRNIAVWASAIGGGAMLAFGAGDSQLSTVLNVSFFGGVLIGGIATFITRNHNKKAEDTKTDDQQKKGELVEETGRAGKTEAADEEAVKEAAEAAEEGGDEATKEAAEGVLAIQNNIQTIMTAIEALEQGEEAAGEHGFFATRVSKHLWDALLELYKQEEEIIKEFEDFDNEMIDEINDVEKEGGEGVKKSQASLEQRKEELEGSLKLLEDLQAKIKKVEGSIEKMDKKQSNAARKGEKLAEKEEDALKEAEKTEKEMLESFKEEIAEKKAKLTEKDANYTWEVFAADLNQILTRRKNLAILMRKKIAEKEQEEAAQSGDDVPPPPEDLGKVDSKTPTKIVQKKIKKLQ